MFDVDKVLKSKNGGLREEIIKFIPRRWQFIVQVEEKFDIVIPNIFLEYGGEETIDQIEKIINEKCYEKSIK